MYKKSLGLFVMAIIGSVLALLGIVLLLESRLDFGFLVPDSITNLYSYEMGIVVLTLALAIYYLFDFKGHQYFALIAVAPLLIYTMLAFANHFDIVKLFTDLGSGGGYRELIISYSGYMLLGRFIQMIAIILVIVQLSLKKAMKGLYITSFVLTIVSTVSILLGVIVINFGSSVESLQTMQDDPMLKYFSEVTIVSFIISFVFVIISFMYNRKIGVGNLVVSKVESQENKPEGSSESSIEMLRKLSQLKEQGILTDEEYEEKKRKHLEKL